MSAPTTFELRSHQKVAVTRLRQALLLNRRLALACPTAFGKTIVALHMIRGILARGERVIFMNEIPFPDRSNDRTVCRLTDIGVILSRARADRHRH